MNKKVMCRCNGIIQEDFCYLHELHELSYIEMVKSGTIRLASGKVELAATFCDWLELYNKCVHRLKKVKKYLYYYNYVQYFAFLK